MGFAPKCYRHWRKFANPPDLPRDRRQYDFEAQFAEYCGVDHCVSLNSGTSALHLALRCLDIGPGDEVITVGMTFIATAWAISYAGRDTGFCRYRSCASNNVPYQQLKTRSLLGPKQSFRFTFMACRQTWMLSRRLLLGMSCQ